MMASREQQDDPFSLCSSPQTSIGSVVEELASATTVNATGAVSTTIGRRGSSARWPSFRLPYCGATGLGLSDGLGEYGPDSCAIILTYVKPGMRALDIGAHIGYHTLLLKRQVGETGEVICFDPLPENRLLLYRNLQLNHLAGSVRIEPMAITNRVSLTSLHLGSSTSQASLQPTDGREGLIVPTCDLGTYCQLLGWLPVHFIKMDVEGCPSAEKSS